MADTAGEGSRGQSCLSSSFNAPSTLWGMCCSLPRHHKAFLWIVFIQALIVIGHRTYQFATVTVTVDTTWFFMLLVVSAIFVVYFAVHSTLFANTFELIAFLAASLFMLIRLVFEFVDQLEDCTGDNLITCEVMFGVSVAFNIISWTFCYRMADDLRWKKYKAIGADLATIKMYKVYEVFVAVRKLDLQFSCIMLLTGFIFFQFTPQERVFLIPNVIVFCIEIVWERVGFLGVREQNKTYMAWFFALSVWLPLFVVVVGLLTASSLDLFNEILHSASIFKLMFTALALVVNRAATVVLGVILYRNFGAGYKGLNVIFDKENNQWEQLQAITAGAGADVEMGRAKPKPKPAPKEPEETKADATDVEAAGSSSDEEQHQGMNFGGGARPSDKRKKHRSKKKHKSKKKKKKKKKASRDGATVTTVNPMQT